MSPSMDKWIKKREYYSDLKKNKTLPSATTWMNLEDVIPSKITRHRKTNTAQSHLHMESETIMISELTVRESRMVGCGAKRETDG